MLIGDRNPMQTPIYIVEFQLEEDGAAPGTEGCAPVETDATGDCTIDGASCLDSGAERTALAGTERDGGAVGETPFHGAIKSAREEAGSTTSVDVDGVFLTF